MRAERCATKVDLLRCDGSLSKQPSLVVALNYAAANVEWRGGECTAKRSRLPTTRFRLYLSFLPSPPQPSPSRKPKYSL